MSHHQHNPIAEATAIMAFLDAHQGKPLRLIAHNGGGDSLAYIELPQHVARSAFAGYKQAQEADQRSEFLTSLADSDPHRWHHA